MDYLTGLVLCGGQSLRMGMDKGLIQTGNSTWAALACKKLEKYCEEVFISINQKQKVNYLNQFQSEKLITDNLKIKGPLCGILSFHQHFPENDLLILACDMLLVTDDLVMQLINIYKNKNRSAFYVFKNNGQIEPLLGIYTSVGLKKIFSKYSINEEFEFSIIKNLISSNTLFIEANNASAFQNFNYPS